MTGRVRFIQHFSSCGLSLSGPDLHPTWPPDKSKFEPPYPPLKIPPAPKYNSSMFIVVEKSSYLQSTKSTIGVIQYVEICLEKHTRVSRYLYALPSTDGQSQSKDRMTVRQRWSSKEGQAEGLEDGWTEGLVGHEDRKT